MKQLDTKCVKNAFRNRVPPYVLIYAYTPVKNGTSITLVAEGRQPDRLAILY
jgi:hypothetical protein